MAPAAMSFVRLHALRRPLGFALLGLCGLGQKPFLSAAGGALPLDELSALHQKFGGDASVWANQPMPQRARSGGTISALSVQIPALERLAPYLRPGASVFDLGFGSGVMTAMLLAAAPSSGVRVIGVDLEDKVKVATENMLKTSGPFRFQREQFEFLGGDAFHCLQRWKDEGKTFDVVYSGCSFDPDTQQLALFLGRLKPTGAAVFNLGNPGKQGMYFVADGGKKCELLMRVNFMMAESPLTPPASDSVPLDPSRLGQWIQQNIFTDKEGVDYETLSQHSDATRDIGVAAQRQHGAALARVGSWHGRSTADVRASDIAQPGGFRRFFFGDAGARPLMEDVMRVQQSETFEVRLASPLLPFYVGKEGIAEQYHLVLMILKGFAGAAVLYLPRSFLNGGLVLGMVTLTAVCFLFTVSMKKLIDCAETVQVKRMTETSMRQQQYMEHGLSKLTVPSYGDMGEEAFGRLGRVLVELSICVSQLGFCSTYFVFVSANVSEVLGTLAGCQHVMSQRSLCLLLAMLWTPLALIRSLKHFSTLNLLADACILLGLIVILAAAVPRLHDVIPWEVPLMKMDSYPLCLGTAAFAFEGIGLVLPMYEGTHPKMRKEFKGTMSWTLAGLCSFFILFASVAYVSFGPTTRTVILFNLHMGGLKRLTSQVLFCMALICTYPLMLHPVSKLIEDRLRGGKTSSMLGEVFAASEAFRVSLVVLTMMVAISCASRLESLVAIVGGLACAPLALVFPPALHHMLVGGQPLQDFILALLGVLLATVSSTQAAMHWRVHQEIPYFSCSGS